MLSILAGQIEADAIAIDRPNKYRIAYLPQEPTFNSGETVLQAVFAGDSPVLQLNRQYEETVAALAMNPTSESLQKHCLAYSNVWMRSKLGMSMPLRKPR